MIKRPITRPPSQPAALLDGDYIIKLGSSLLTTSHRVGFSYLNCLFVVLYIEIYVIFHVPLHTVYRHSIVTSSAVHYG